MAESPDYAWGWHTVFSAAIQENQWINEAAEYIMLAIFNVKEYTPPNGPPDETQQG